MAVVVRFRAVLGDRCVGCGRPGFPTGRARFLVAGEGPPLLVLHAICPRPLEDDERSSTRGRLAPARAWARAAATCASSSAGCRGCLGVGRCRWRRGPRGRQWAAPGAGAHDGGGLPVGGELPARHGGRLGQAGSAPAAFVVDVTWIARCARAAWRLVQWASRGGCAGSPLAPRVSMLGDGLGGRGRLGRAEAAPAASAGGSAPEVVR